MPDLSEQDVRREQTRPFYLLRPDLSADGTKWMALYGSSLGSGVAGFGETPAEAARDFDRAFQEELTPSARQQQEQSGVSGPQPPG